MKPLPRLSALLFATGMACVAGAQFRSDGVSIGTLYQEFTLEGVRTASSGLSLGVEFGGNGLTTWDLSVQLMNRTDAPEELLQRVPSYDQVLRVAPGVRRYLRSLQAGPYVGGTLGIGHTKDAGMSMDLLGRFGYAVRSGAFRLDLAVQLGAGHYAFSEEIYENDQLVRVDRYSLWGGVFQPTLAAGFHF
ncbi:MAG: hypothetical protein KDB77_03265 [Flavobacteriales bacterium]|nr:hypothetical protein [Flavobacteriales bacterium]